MTNFLVNTRRFALFVSKRLDKQATKDCRTSRAEQWSEGAEEWSLFERELFTLIGWFGFTIQHEIVPIFNLRPDAPRQETGGSLRRDDDL